MIKKIPTSYILLAFTLIVYAFFIYYPSSLHAYTYDITTLYPLSDPNRYGVMSLDNHNGPKFIFDNGIYATVENGNWHYEKMLDLSTLENPVNTSEQYLITCNRLSMAVDSNDNTHVIYMDENLNKYIYAKRINGLWSNMAFNITPYSGVYECKTSIVIDKFDHPHVILPEQCSLRYFFFDGSQWLDYTFPQSCSASYTFALDRNQHPHILFHIYSFENSLKHIWNDGTKWQEETIQCDLQWTSPSLSITFDNYNHIHLGIGGNGVQYLHHDGTQWVSIGIEPLETHTRYLQLVLDGGRVHLVYSFTQSIYSSNSFLRHAYFDGEWHKADIDPEKQSGGYSTVFIDSASRLHICYQSYYTSGLLKPGEMRYATTIFKDDVDPSFSISAQEGEAPLSVQFSDLSTGPVTGWLWEFGDGATSSEKSPSHLYQKPGRFSVRLTVEGPKESRSKEVKNCIWTYVPEKTQGYYSYVTAMDETPAMHNYLYIIDCRTNKIISRIFMPSRPWNVVSTPDGKLIFIACYGGEVVQLNRDSRQYEKIYFCSIGLSGLAISQDGRYVYASAGNVYGGSVYRIDTQKSTITEIKMTNGDWLFNSVNQIVLTPEDDTILGDIGSYTPYEGYGSWTGWAAGISNPFSEKPLLWPLYYDGQGWGAICVSPNGRHLYGGRHVTGSPTSGSYGVITKNNYLIPPLKMRWVAQERVLEEYWSQKEAATTVGPLPQRLRVSPDGKWLYATHDPSLNDPSTLTVIDTKTNEAVKKLYVGFHPRGIAFTPDGKYAYVCAKQMVNSIPTGKVSVVDVEKMQIIKSICFVGNEMPMGVAVAPSGVAQESGAIINLLLLD